MQETKGTYTGHVQRLPSAAMSTIHATTPRIITALLSATPALEALLSARLSWRNCIQNS